MLPFTYQMYHAYRRYVSNEHIQNARFDYNFAVGQLNDESTVGDFEEVNYLKNVYERFRSASFSTHELELVEKYAEIVKHK